jgi:hypothetical protein
MLVKPLYALFKTCFLHQILLAWSDQENDLDLHVARIRINCTIFLSMHLKAAKHSGESFREGKNYKS